MQLNQVKSKLAEIVNCADNRRVIIINSLQNNDIRYVLEEMSSARRVNPQFQLTAKDEFLHNGKTIDVVESLRERCTPTSGTNFDYDDPKYTTLYTIDYLFLPDQVAAIEYMAGLFGKNYISVADYNPKFPKTYPNQPGFEVFEYDGKD